jgi:hypothetical protein
MKLRNALIPFELCCCTALVGLSGCASLTRPVPARKPTQVYASLTKTWGAAVDYFARSGVSLDTTDRSSGVIRADVTTMSRDKSHFRSCGSSIIKTYWSEDQGWYWYTQPQDPPVGAPFIAIVRGDSAHATLTVNSEWINAAGKEVKCSETLGWWDQQTEAAIKTQAELSP